MGRIVDPLACMPRWFMRSSIHDAVRDPADPLQVTYMNKHPEPAVDSSKISRDGLLNGSELVAGFKNLHDGTNKNCTVSESAESSSVLETGRF